MFNRRDIPGIIVSLMLHLVILVPLAYLQMGGRVEDIKVAIESVFSEDRPQEEIQKVLDTDTTIAETNNIMQGGAVTQAIGGSATGPATQITKIETSSQLKDPTVKVNIGDISMPGVDQLGDDLGEAEVTGEIGAVVEGYGAALGRVTQELLRMMREDRVLVVWLFDESESMKDDQAQIREQFHKVYEELGLAQERDTQLKNQKEVLLTAIHSYGDKVNALTPKPTSDVPEIRDAIDRIGIDESGKENMCLALNVVLDKYGPVVKKTHRKLAIILVSDESGDDGQGPLIDEVLLKAKRSKSPVYILGREAVFGYPYARMRWRDPKYGLDHWLQINRGPETAYPEALQFDGFHARWDAHSSGFGPYEQARLAKETGGIFFVLPHEEENLVGAEAVEKRKFAFLDLKEYNPELIPRREYEEIRAKSKFRSAVWDVVKLLNPYLDKEMNLQTSHYSIDRAEFQKGGSVQFQRGLRDMGLLYQAMQILEKVKPLREKEDSQRWRANYDLALAQTMAYRVRIFQFLLAMDKHGKNFPTPKDPKTNIWNLRLVHEMLTPDAAQVKTTKIDTEELKRQEQQAKDLFEFVRKSHPRTPWSNRADYELGMGFSVRFVEGFHDPRYRQMTDIKVPTL